MDPRPGCGRKRACNEEIGSCKGILLRIPEINAVRVRIQHKSRKVRTHFRAHVPPRRRARDNIDGGLILTLYIKRTARMRHHFWKPFALVIIAFALTAVSPSSLYAQDRPDDRHDEKPAEHHDDHAAARPDERRPDERRPDASEQYRHDHPGASARCHDGFFTKTPDRNRACTRHGGIDVWLVL
jgi:hypothetical protein